MTNDTPKEGVVIDVAPEPETPTPDTESLDQAADQPDSATPPPARPARPATGRLAGLALAVAAGALGLTLAGGWYGHQLWQGVQGELAGARDTAGQARNLDQRLAGVEATQQSLSGQLGGVQAETARTGKGLTEVQRQFAEQQQLLTGERSLLDEREAQLRGLVNSLTERLGRTGNQWLVAEADYLLQLADHRLRLAADPATARAALALADERLHATGDPGWAGVREQIARDLATLDTLEQPDVTGLWSRLGALAGQVPNLKPKDEASDAKPVDAPSLTVTSSGEERTWRTLLADLWQGIKNAVRIRRNDQPVAALLPPEQAYFLYENLRLKLEQGRLALVQGREEVYRQALAEARGWLTEHFAADATGRGMDKALAELEAQPIRAALPDLSTSLRALRARRALLESASVPAEAPAAEAPSA